MNSSGSFPCYLNDANTSKEISVASSPTVEESLGDILKTNNIIIDNTCYYPTNNILGVEVFIPFQSFTKK